MIVLRRDDARPRAVSVQPRQRHDDPFRQTIQAPRAERADKREGAQQGLVDIFLERKEMTRLGQHPLFCQQETDHKAINRRAKKQ